MSIIICIIIMLCLYVSVGNKFGISVHGQASRQRGEDHVGDGEEDGAQRNQTIE